MAVPLTSKCLSLSLTLPLSLKINVKHPWVRINKERKGRLWRHVSQRAPGQGLRVACGVRPRRSQRVSDRSGPVSARPRGQEGRTAWRETVAAACPPGGLCWSTATRAGGRRPLPRRRCWEHPPARSLHGGLCPGGRSPRQGEPGASQPRLLASTRPRQTFPGAGGPAGWGGGLGQWVRSGGCGRTAEGRTSVAPSEGGPSRVPGPRGRPGPVFLPQGRQRRWLFSVALVTPRKVIRAPRRVSSDFRQPGRPARRERRADVGESQRRALAWSAVSLRDGTF